jgi:hypothetical protein
MAKADCDETVSLIALVNKYSKGNSWLSFSENYSQDFYTLLQSSEDPKSLTSLTDSKQSNSVANDFMNETFEALALARNIGTNWSQY